MVAVTSYGHEPYTHQIHRGDPGSSAGDAYFQSIHSEIATESRWCFSENQEHTWEPKALGVVP